ncbi:MAG: hypothetical protein ABFS56_18980 [Pseudomonadota bacterium]
MNFEVDIQSEGRYCAIEPTLVTKISQIAWQKGVSMETLVNLWLQDKLAHDVRTRKFYAKTNLHQ